MRLVTSSNHNMANKLSSNWVVFGTKLQNIGLIRVLLGSSMSWQVHEISGIQKTKGLGTSTSTNSSSSSRPMQRWVVMVVCQCAWLWTNCRYELIFKSPFKAHHHHHNDDDDELIFSIYKNPFDFFMGFFSFVVVVVVMYFVQIEILTWFVASFFQLWERERECVCVGVFSVSFLASRLQSPHMRKKDVHC